MSPLDLVDSAIRVTIMLCMSSTFYAASLASCVLPFEARALFVRATIPLYSRVCEDAHRLSVYFSKHKKSSQNICRFLLGRSSLLSGDGNGNGNDSSNFEKDHSYYCCDEETVSLNSESERAERCRAFTQSALELFVVLPRWIYSLRLSSSAVLSTSSKRLARVSSTHTRTSNIRTLAPNVRTYQHTPDASWLLWVVAHTDAHLPENQIENVCDLGLASGLNVMHVVAHDGTTDPWCLEDLVEVISLWAEQLLQTARRHGAGFHIGCTGLMSYVVVTAVRRWITDNYDLNPTSIVLYQLFVGFFPDSALDVLTHHTMSSRELLGVWARNDYGFFPPMYVCLGAAADVDSAAIKFVHSFEASGGNATRARGLGSVLVSWLQAREREWLDVYAGGRDGAFSPVRSTAHTPVQRLVDPLSNIGSSAHPVPRYRRGGGGGNRNGNGSSNNVSAAKPQKCNPNNNSNNKYYYSTTGALEQQQQQQQQRQRQRRAIQNASTSPSLFHSVQHQSATSSRSRGLYRHYAGSKHTSNSSSVDAAGARLSRPATTTTSVLSQSTLYQASCTPPQQAQPPPAAVDDVDDDVFNFVLEPSLATTTAANSGPPPPPTPQSCDDDDGDDIEEEDENVPYCNIGDDDNKTKSKKRKSKTTTMNGSAPTLGSAWTNNSIAEEFSPATLMAWTQNGL
eukprot:PhM_4_TR11299/c0_g1_i1/m.93257